MEPTVLQRDFHHPYQPYSIQLDFMNALYDVLEDGCVGLFESPTGTGKSLSLICGSITWLRDHKRRMLEGELAKGDEKDSEEPEWVLAHAREERKENAIRARRNLEERLRKVREKEKRDRERYMRSGDQGPGFGKRRVGILTTDATGKRLSLMKKGAEDKNANLISDILDEEAQFELDDYQSDDETGHAKASENSADNGLSKETLELLKKFGGPLGKKEEDEEEIDDIKIFYCSRTHSQLAQFTAELRRVSFPPTYDYELTNSPNENSEKIPNTEVVKHLPLGSRKVLCINEKVNTSAAGASAVSEKCLDLQQSSTSEEHRCPFLLPKANDERRVLERDFRDMALAEVRDIEDLRYVSTKLGVCGYYASREAVKPSEIVTLPYPLLLQQSSREALHLSVKDHIIIIDEAHNLMDAIANIHSLSISLSQLNRCSDNLTAYLLKFGKRLKGANRVYVAQCLRLAKALKGWLEEKKFSFSTSKSTANESIVSQGELLRLKGIDQINIYKLGKYLETSKLARKVEGYILFTEDAQTQLATVRKGPNVAREKKKQGPAGLPLLSHVYSFLLILTNPEKEGKVFYGPIETDGPDGQVQYDVGLRYMLLDPAHHFKVLVDEARAIILAGGTMEPMDDYVNYLFPYLPSEKIRKISCGHVIPKENMLVMTVPSGAGGHTFEFNFERRNDVNMILDLGRSILNLCNVIPDGVVVFFPSYAYLELVATRWKEKPASEPSQSIWEKLARRKAIFMESKGSSSVDDVLTEYSHAIDANHGGGLLLSVVGGKMSEGINFSDRLGRAVIMVGLPFPNAHSAEWKAKLQHIEKTVFSADPQDSDVTTKSVVNEATRRGNAKAAAREYYENACMRAVNQSVGRAIRHREDYAVVLLFDRRYGNGNIWGKLPGWIRRGTDVKDREEKKFGEVMKGVGGFFRGKKTA